MWLNYHLYGLFQSLKFFAIPRFANSTKRPTHLVSTSWCGLTTTVRFKGPWLTVGIVGSGFSDVSCIVSTSQTPVSGFSADGASWWERSPWLPFQRNVLNLGSQHRFRKASWVCRCSLSMIALFFTCASSLFFPLSKNQGLAMPEPSATSYETYSRLEVARWVRVVWKW